MQILTDGGFMDGNDVFHPVTLKNAMDEIYKICNDDTLLDAIQAAEDKAGMNESVSLNITIADKIQQILDNNNMPDTGPADFTDYRALAAEKMREMREFKIESPKKKNESPKKKKKSPLKRVKSFLRRNLGL